MQKPMEIKRSVTVNNQRVNYIERNKQRLREMSDCGGAMISKKKEPFSMAEGAT